MYSPNHVIFFLLYSLFLVYCIFQEYERITCRMFTIFTKLLRQATLSTHLKSERIRWGNSNRNNKWLRGLCAALVGHTPQRDPNYSLICSFIRLALQVTSAFVKIAPTALLLSCALYNNQNHYYARPSNRAQRQESSRITTDACYTTIHSLRFVCANNVTSIHYECLYCCLFNAHHVQNFF